jgi:hypothetical protein
MLSVIVDGLVPCKVMGVVEGLQVDAGVPVGSPAEHETAMLAVKFCCGESVSW